MEREFGVHPRLVFNVLQNPHNLLVAKQKVAREASPPKARTPPRASPKARAKERTRF